MTFFYFLSEFNTARWNKSVTDLPWPGPKKMEKNITILTNFTCHFKVIILKNCNTFQMNTATHSFISACQAFREPAPPDLPLDQSWNYDLNEAFVLIVTAKFIFIFIFEVSFEFSIGHKIQNLIINIFISFTIVCSMWSRSWLEH